MGSKQKCDSRGGEKERRGEYQGQEEGIHHQRSYERPSAGSTIGSLSE